MIQLKTLCFFVGVSWAFAGGGVMESNFLFKDWISFINTYNGSSSLGVDTHFCLTVGTEGLDGILFVPSMMIPFGLEAFLLEAACKLGLGLIPELDLAP